MTNDLGSSPWGYMTGAAGAVDSLRRAGVTRAYGIPVVETSHLFGAFASSPIETVLTTQEQCAAFMADAHARCTGELSACVLAPGPGLLNALGGIAQARLDSSPIVVLVAGDSGSMPLPDTARTETLDQLDVARPVCKRVFRLEEPEEIPPAMARAVRLAREGEPGPVLVEIPVDVQRREGRMEGTGFRPGPRSLTDEASAQLERLAKRLSRARRVGLYVGAGCLGAREELTELAERLDAPVSTTLSGLGVLPHIHPLLAGFGLAAGAAPLVEQTFADCDLVLAVGCKFSEASPGGVEIQLKAELVHVDIEPGNLGRLVPAALTIAAPAKLALRRLLDRVEGQQHPEVREIIRAGKRRWRACLAGRESWDDAVDPLKLFVELRELMASEDVVVVDSGRHAFHALAAYPVQAPNTLLAPVDYRSVGFSVPAAVAVKLARPDERVVACVGDAGFLQTGLELLTARRCNVAPVVVVFSDGALDLDLESAQQELMIARETCVELVPVNLEQLAGALGVDYVLIRNDRELVAGLKRALTCEAPVVVEARVAYRDAASYLKASQRADYKGIPRAAALRLGARQVLRKLLESGSEGV